MRATSLFLLLVACDVPVVVLRAEALGDGGVLDAGGADAQPSLTESDWTLSAGSGHSCAVRGGALYCWGDGRNGQLGQGATASSDRPLRVGGDTDWVRVSTGDLYTCGLKANGAIACFGANGAGQLGLSDLDDRSVPTPVPLPPALEISARHGHTCAVLRDGELWCWGANLEGQLGLGDNFPGADRPQPSRVSGGLRFSAVATGQGHTCAITQDQALYCWGRNSSEHLGLGPDAEVQYRTPQRVGSDNNWLSLAAGQESTCAIRRDHSLWCWGLDFETTQNVDRPTPRGAGADYGLVRVDAFHLCALKLDGALWCQGRGIEGQLGRGNTDASPALAHIEPGRRFSSVSVGRLHTCARDDAGRFFCAGDNAEGKLGVGDTNRRSVLSELLLE